jgi:hypothetical protein
MHFLHCGPSKPIGSDANENKWGMSTEQALQAMSLDPKKSQTSMREGAQRGTQNVAFRVGQWLLQHSRCNIVNSAS